MHSMETRNRKRKGQSPTTLPDAGKRPALKESRNGDKPGSSHEKRRARREVIPLLKDKVPREKDIDEENAEILKTERANEENRKEKYKPIKGKRRMSISEETFEISIMTIDDLKSVFRLGEKIFTTDYPELHRTWDEFEVVNNFNSETEYCFIIKASNKIVGFALGTIIEKSSSGWKYGYLAWIGVQPKYQRKGCGTKLCNHFKQLMCEKEVQMMLADTNSSNAPAVNFLNKMGFGHQRDHVYLSLNLDKDRRLREGQASPMAIQFNAGSKKKLAPRIIPPTLPMPTNDSSSSLSQLKTNYEKKRNEEDKGKVIVREMEIDDLADVFHLGERIFTSKFVNLYRIWSEWEVTDLYNSDPEYCYVAEVDGKIAGFSMGYIIKKSKSAWTYGYLVWLGVSPDFQRMGIANNLFSRFKNMMQEEGVRMLIIDTQADNEPAVRFFEKAGFGHPQQHMYLSLNLNPDPVAEIAQN